MVLEQCGERSLRARQAVRLHDHRFHTVADGIGRRINAAAAAGMAGKSGAPRNADEGTLCGR